MKEPKIIDKMAKLNCMVISDKLETWPARGNNPAGQARRIVVMDMDDKPVTKLISVTIPEKSPVTGDIHEGADISKSVITLSYTDIRQGDKSKELSARGEVESIDGRFGVTPTKPAAVKAAA